MKGPPQYRSQSRRVDFPFGLRRGQRAIRGTCRSPLAEESRTYAESPAFNPLRASASNTVETRYARKGGMSKPPAPNESRFCSERGREVRGFRAKQVEAQAMAHARARAKAG